MTRWELWIFVALVLATFVAIVAMAWLVQWRRNPERFKESWKRTPMPGSPNDWNRPR